MATGLQLAKIVLASSGAVAGQSRPARADVKAGVDAWSRGEYEAAVKQWRDPAIKGDADAQFNMGQAYKMGRGVKADLSIALDWYRKAAAQGHLQASDSYGHLLHYQGKIPESLPYLQASSDRGDPARAIFARNRAFQRRSYSEGLGALICFDDPGVLGWNGSSVAQPCANGPVYSARTASGSHGAGRRTRTTCQQVARSAGCRFPGQHRSACKDHQAGWCAAVAGIASRRARIPLRTSPWLAFLPEQRPPSKAICRQADPGAHASQGCRRKSRAGEPQHLPKPPPSRQPP